MVDLYPKVECFGFQMAFEYVLDKYVRFLLGLLSFYFQSGFEWCASLDCFIQNKVFVYNNLAEPEHSKTGQICLVFKWSKTRWQPFENRTIRRYKQAFEFRTIQKPFKIKLTYFRCHFQPPFFFLPYENQTIP
jgi:hypothetical protein